MLGRIKEYLKKEKNLVNIFLVYFFLTFVMGYLDFDRRVVSFEESTKWIEKTAQRDAPLPMINRILIPYTLYFLYKISHIPLMYIYAFFRFFFFFLSFVLFHIYLKKWFDDKTA